MGLNPLEYDVEELRELGGVAPAPAAPEDRDGFRTPYLRTLPSGERADALVEAWLTGLVGAGGSRGAAAALYHYQRVGWLSAGVRVAASTHLLGMESRRGGFDEFDRADHMRSLGYVGRLAALAAADPSG
jgi:archaellum component FlaD/FlaE